MQKLARTQAAGFAWTLFYAAVTGFGPGAFHNSDVESVLVVFVLPVACLLTVFGYFRTGGIIAFGTLTIATLMLSRIEGEIGHFGVAPTAISLIALLFGGPAALLRSLWLAYRTSAANNPEADAS